MELQLNVNPGKCAILAFTIKRNISKLVWPFLLGEDIEYSRGVKYTEAQLEYSSRKPESQSGPISCNQKEVKMAICMTLRKGEGKQIELFHG